MNWKAFVLGILIFFVFLATLIFALNKIGEDLSNHYTIVCNEKEGSLVTYDHDAPGKRAGTYCVLPDGTEEDITIRRAVN